MERLKRRLRLMVNRLSEKEEENLHGFTGDMKEFLRKGDFESAVILINDLKKYVLEIKKKRERLRNNGK